MQCELLPFVCVKPAVIYWTCIATSNRCLSHWLKVVRVWVCIKQRKMWIATVESTILTLSRSAQREQDSRMCWNLCLEFKETKCKKTTIPSKHNSRYLKRSRNNNASLCIQIHTYTYTQTNTHISGVFSKTISVISFICVSWVPVFLH